MSVSADDFRAVMGAVAAPVAVVTAMDHGRSHGTTVSAFTSLSLDPPMVLVALDRDSALLSIVTRTRRFGLNVLTAEQSGLALTFARKATRNSPASPGRTSTGYPGSTPSAAGSPATWTS